MQCDGAGAVWCARGVVWVCSAVYGCCVRCGRYGLWAIESLGGSKWSVWSVGCSVFRVSEVAGVVVEVWRLDGLLLMAGCGTVAKKAGGHRPPAGGPIFALFKRLSSFPVHTCAWVPGQQVEVGRSFWGVYGGMCNCGTTVFWWGAAGFSFGGSVTIFLNFGLIRG